MKTNRVTIKMNEQELMQMKSTDPESLAIDKNSSEYIQKILSSLSQKEETVIRMRNGLGVERAYTLKEIGAELGVHQNYIRLIEAQALRKLRHYSKAAKLLPLTDDKTFDDEVYRRGVGFENWMAIIRP